MGGEIDYHKSISVKENAIAQQEFKLTHYDVALQHVKQYTAEK